MVIRSNKDKNFDICQDLCISRDDETKRTITYKCQIEDMYDCGKRRLQAFQLSLEKSEEYL